MEYEIDHPKVGIIRYLKNNKAKRIIISIKPRYVRVTIPRRQTLKNAQKFVEQKIDWMQFHELLPRLIVENEKVKAAELDYEAAVDSLKSEYSAYYLSLIHI